MAKFDNIIIVSDMDGTFLGKKSRIVPENMEAVKYFTSNGGLFTFITGRNYTSVFLPLPELREIINAPVGFHNGACIYDIVENKKLDETCMDKDVSVEVLSYLQKFYPKYKTTVRCNMNFLAVVDDEDVRKDFYLYKEYYKIATYQEVRESGVHKIVYSGDPGEVNETRLKIDEKFGKYIDCTTAGSGWIEIMPKGISKGMVIPKLRKIMNIPNAKFFSIGDYENDIEMLESADYGACPENAYEKAKEIAKIHVCNNDDGAIADLIRVIEEKYIG